MVVFIKNIINLVTITLLFFQYQYVYASGLEEKVFPADFKILSIAQDVRNEHMYIGGKSGLYLLTGSKLNKLIIPAGIKEVRSICITKNSMYGVFDSGLFVKDLNDTGQFWQRKYDTVNPEGVELFNYDKDQIVTWNKKNIFIVNPEGVEKLKGVTGEENIIKIKTIKNIVFMLTNTKCAALDKPLNTWKKILSIDKNRYKLLSETVNTDALSDNDESLFRSFIPDIDVDSRTAVVSTLSGVYVFDHQIGKLEKLSPSGLPMSDVKYIAVKKESIYISTLKKLYVIEKNDSVINEIYLRNGIVDLAVLSSDKSDYKKMQVWVGGGNRLFGVKVSGQDFQRQKFYQNKGGLVSIKEVQGMAIEYAEVSPEKINKWRKAAKYKAILPKVSFGLSESNDENIEIYKSASKHYVVNGPSEVDRDWSIDLSWDLSNLIWNNAQTSIDVRSKLMVQLRNDILEEVTRLYFERMRLLGELAVIVNESNEPENLEKKKMRVQEITAYIDAYTGGKFSENIFSNKNEIISKHNK